MLQIFIPMCVDNHWLLAVIYSHRNEICLLNSRRTRESEIEVAKSMAKSVEKQLVHADVMHSAAACGWSDIQVSKWKVTSIFETPQQTDE
jgi:Ulp1 family protease